MPEAAVPRPPSGRWRTARVLLLCFALALAVLAYIYAGLGPAEQPRRPGRVIGLAPVWLPVVALQFARFDTLLGRVLASVLLALASALVMVATYLLVGCLALGRCL